MKAGLLWSRILTVAGFVLMLLGAVDPLEGSFVVLLGGGMVALGAFLGRSRRRKFLLWAFILLVVGVGALWAMTAMGGLGKGTGRSMWWGLVLLPFPVGWIMGLVGAVLRLIEAFKGRPPVSRDPGAEAK